MNIDHKWIAGVCWTFAALMTAISPCGCSNGRKAGQELTARALVASDVTWTGHEMLGRPTDHSITVKAIATQAIEAYFEYGLASGSTSGSTAQTTYPTGSIEAVIDGLSANTRYYYRMRYRPSGSTAAFLTGTEYSFNTKRASGATFTFAVQSDSHQGFPAFYSEAMYTKTVGNIAAGNPDFVFDLGDAVSLDDATETDATARTKYLAQRTFFAVPGNSAAIFLVLGNHENEEGWNLDDFGADVAKSLPVLGANARKRTFVNPVPDGFYTGNTDASVTQIDGDHLRGDYYAFAWGNALFVAIDPYWYTMKKPYAGSLGGEKDDEGTGGTRWDWTLGQQQFQWLKQTLESSNAPLKFVFSHQPVGGVDTDNYGRGGKLAAKYCEMGGKNIDGNTSGWSSNRAGWGNDPIHQIFAKNHVTAFFHGHDHVYAKEDPLDGVVYQEVPMAAHPTNDYMGFPTNPSDYAGANLIGSSGHLRVTVSTTGAKVEYVRSYVSGGTNGAIADSYTLVGCTPDSDSDGTNDCLDLCPSDAQKTVPGVCGCGVAETDSDNDGTLDCKDGCPSDPAKTTAGQCGCGVADPDTDGDGTANCKDGCPSDNKKLAPGVCGCGVADTDTDGDGTADCKDGCPNDKKKLAPGVCGCDVADTDTDGDGTADCNDQCPSDKNKVAPGVCGCGVPEGTCTDLCPDDPNKTQPGQCGCGTLDTDSDGDGTANCNDGCPSDKKKIAPGACGCGVLDSDSDGDGTANCNDGCPGDKNKVAPGACGCGTPDTDDDADGTPDCNDLCPSDKKKVASGVCGCGVADTDSDGDGTADCNDQCPSDKKKVAPGVCGCGVADADSDGDGVADCNDGCPNDKNKTSPGACGCGVAESTCVDQCPDDPAKIQAGQCGCGVPDLDANGNGIMDCKEPVCSAGSCSCSSVSFSSDHADNSVPVGTTVVFSAAATCSAGIPLFLFRVLRPMSTWQTLKTWGAESTLAWPTAGLAAGMYWLQVWTRETSSPNTFDSTSLILFKLQKP